MLTLVGGRIWPRVSVTFVSVTVIVWPFVTSVSGT